MSFLLIVFQYGAEVIPLPISQERLLWMLIHIYRLIHKTYFFSKKEFLLCKHCHQKED